MRGDVDHGQSGAEQEHLVLIADAGDQVGTPWVDQESRVALVDTSWQSRRRAPRCEYDDVGPQFPPAG